MLKTFGGLTKEMIRGLREKARKEDRSQLVTWGNKMTCISNQLQNLKALACGTKFLIGEDILQEILKKIDHIQTEMQTPNTPEPSAKLKELELFFDTKILEKTRTSN
eukprot:TRINITY_DN1353_c0_g1_i4.p1 TRINITY_DN1353_c0_g1~~TRINITY_DN1353_c0_g1_i4.p1  ORF type:complete len:107 (-),score=31.92 TRINITY_DN1353_c0_g1_i4:55-375(-)